MAVNESAFIKLVPQSARQSITVDDLKGLLLQYKDAGTKTGQQISWDYDHHSFPYEIKQKDDGNQRWFYLASDDERYNLIAFAIDQETVKGKETEQIQTYIQVTLGDHSTSGDKAKANELCRYLGRTLQAELHLFNKRIMYFYKRK